MPVVAVVQEEVEERRKHRDCIVGDSLEKRTFLVERRSGLRVDIAGGLGWEVGGYCGSRGEGRG